MWVLEIECGPLSLQLKCFTNSLSGLRMLLFLHLLSLSFPFLSLYLLSMTGRGKLFPLSLPCEWQEGWGTGTFPKVHFLRLPLTTVLVPELCLLPSPLSEPR